ncbi:MAG TPA: hypothetical protein PK179_12700, partial [Spirochaetales bacterium]|nr:hypothetical protein [Spirochaetales bacterium]
MVSLAKVVHEGLEALGDRADIIGGLLGEVLGLPEQTITDALGAQFHIKVADLRNESPQRDALDLVGEELSRRHRVLPFNIDADGRSWIVTVNPRDDEAIRALTEACGRVGLLLGNGSD